MTTDEKNYIASRYNDYAKCLPEYRKPEAAAAIKQLMVYFGIEELQLHRDTNVTYTEGDTTITLTSLGAELLSLSDDEE